MNELALFAGAGGGLLASCLLGWRTVCAVELDEYARHVLVARQNDGCLEPFPIWDDVRTFDGCPWRGVVDVVSGGFPCQDISVAGKGEGIGGPKSGLWREMVRIIKEAEPPYVCIENSPALVARGLGTVLSDLAQLGYDARWGLFSAAAAGAPHIRERLWLLAHAHGMRELQPQGRIRAVWRRLGDRSEAEAVNANGIGRWPLRPTELGGGWQTEPDVGRVAHGVAARVDRLRCLGNGQVPAVAAKAWRTL